MVYTRREHQYGTDTLTYVVDDKYPASVSVKFDSPLQFDEFQLVQFDDAATYELLENDPFFRGYEGDRRLTHILDLPEGMSAAIEEDGTSIVFDPQDADSGVVPLRYVVDSTFEETVYFHIARPVRDDVFTVDGNSQSFAYDVMENDWYYELRNFRNRIRAVDAVTDVSVVSEQGGTVAIAENRREILYTPPAGFVGDDTFTYTADGQHEASVRIVVRDPLEAESHLRLDSYSLIAGTVENSLDVLANDFVGDGYQGDRIITGVDALEDGIVEIAEDGKSLLFTPSDESNSYDFTYTVDNEIVSRVLVRTQSIASGHRFEFDERGTEVLTLIDDEAIPENYTGEAVITSVTQPENGGTVEILPNGGQVVIELGSGSGQFQYTLDGKYSGLVFLDYESRLRSDYFAIPMNSAVQTLDVLANDFDSSSERRYGTYGGEKLVTAVEESEHGTVGISADGQSITFQPNEDYVGSARLVYEVDNFLKTHVEIDVARLLRHDRVHVDPDRESQALLVLENDLVGGQYSGGLVITGVSEGEVGAEIAVSSDGKSILYTPPQSFTGSDTIEYTVDDQLKASVTVEVNQEADHLYPKVESLDAFQELVLEATFPDGAISFPVLGADQSTDATPEAGGGALREHSETNVQVEGVDEADLIETDSDYIYTLTHGNLVITKAWPADDMQVVSTTDFKGNAVGQYLYEDRITIISQEHVRILPPEVKEQESILDLWRYPSEPFTYITVLDVSDRANPSLVQRTEIEGSHVQTRRIDDFVYAVVSDSSSLRDTAQWICEGEDDDSSCRYETKEEQTARIQDNFASVVEDLLPNYESYGPDEQLVRSGLLIEPEDIFDPISESASSLISVVALDVTNNEPGLATTTGVLTTGASELYVTAENLYVFEEHYGWFVGGESLSG